METLQLRTVIMEQGYCTIDSVFTPDECQDMRDRLQTYWRAQGAPPMKSFGFTIHPMLPRIPELKRFLIHPVLINAISEMFNEEAVLKHGGARMSDDRCEPAIGWHDHYAWDPARIPQRKRCERLLAGIYVDGSNAASGPLTAIPRRYNEPLGNAPQGDDPREVAIDCPPGSIVIFDTALWHRAKRGNARAIRHLFGGHYMPKSDLRPHPEDNDVC
jgi:hypothetical protein